MTFFLRRLAGLMVPYALRTARTPTSFPDTLNSGHGGLHGQSWAEFGITLLNKTRLA